MLKFRFVFAVCCLMVFGTKEMARAQGSSATSSLSCNLVWNRTLVVDPVDNANGDVYKEKAKQQLIASGQPSDVAEKTASDMAQSFVMSSKGMSQSSTVDITRYQNTTLCKIVASSPVFKEGVADYQSALIINYSDGKNFVSLDSGDGKQYPKHAEITRDYSKELQDVSKDYGIFIYLSLQPVDKFFLPSDPQSPLASGELSEVTHKINGTPPILYRAVLNANSSVPTKVEAFLGDSKKPFKVYKADDIQSLGGGVFVARHISIEAFDEVGKQIWKADYQLLKSAFGRDVDLSVLDTKKIVPKGTTVADSRLGEGKTVLYRIRNGGFPSDASVEKLVAKKGGSIQQSTTEKQSASRFYVMPIGLLLFVGGLFWFRRTRQTKV